MRKRVRERVCVCEPLDWAIACRQRCCKETKDMDSSEYGQHIFATMSGVKTHKQSRFRLLIGYGCEDTSRSKINVVLKTKLTLKMSMLIIDIETTGLELQTHEITVSIYAPIAYCLQLNPTLHSQQCVQLFVQDSLNLQSRVQKHANPHSQRRVGGRYYKSF